MAKSYWLVKQEPDAYSWETLVQDGETAWTGVRNFLARNNLRAMKEGDLVLFYHSGSVKAVVGIAEVSNEAYVDPTAKEGDWSAVDLRAVRPLTQPVSLERIKGEPELKEMQFVRQSRLSISSVTAAQFKRIVSLAKTKL